MNKLRVQNLHNKAQIIKQYDDILRQLNKELSADNNTHNKSRTKVSSQAEPFYVTEIEPTAKVIK